MIIYEIPKNHKLYNEHIFYIGTIYKDIYFLVVNKKVDQKIIKKMINESLIFDNYNSMNSLSLILGAPANIF